MIQETKNYNMFDCSSLNRYDRQTLRTKSKYKDLKRNIHENGQNEPIVCNQDYLITNGETRLMVCRDLGISVLYKIEDMTKKETYSRMLEAGLSKKWSAKDICNFWNQLSQPQYGKALAVCEKTSIPLSFLTHVNKVANGTTIDIGSYEFNHGQLVDFDEETLMLYANIIKPIIASKKFTSPRIVINCFEYSVREQGFKKTERLFQVITTRLNRQLAKVTKAEAVAKMTTLGRASKFALDFPSGLITK